MMPSSSLLKPILAQLGPILEPSLPQLGLFRPPRTLPKPTFSYGFPTFLLIHLFRFVFLHLELRGPVLVPSWPHLAPSWALFAAILGPSWAPFGPYLGPFWPPWALFRPLSGSFGRLGAIRLTSFNYHTSLKPSGGHLGPFRVDLKSSWGRLGLLVAPPVASFGPLSGFLRPSWGLLSHIFPRQSPPKSQETRGGGRSP